MQNERFKNLPKGFSQRFLLLAVYFSSLLDSVVFKQTWKNIYKLARSKPPFCFREGNSCLLIALGETLHLFKAT